MSDTPARPRHTSLATAIIIGASVGVVVSVAEQLAGLQSLETRELVTDFLSRPPGDGLGIDVTSALSMLRVLLMLLAACATTAAVLGFSAMKGDTRARLGLSVLAVPIFLGGLATGGFLTSLVAAGTALLWVGPSALWFRGEPIPEPSPRPESRPLPSRQPPPVPAPFAQPQQGSVQQQELAPAEPVVRRPDAVVWACVLTWAFASLTIVVMAASAVLMSSNPEMVFDELARQNADLGGTDSATLTEATYVTAGLVGGWSLLAIVLGVLTYRRVRWGRLGLVASAGVAAVVCLVAALSSLLLIVPAAATLATVVLLNRPEVRGWFNRT
ncbi:MAG: hypothetical protein ACXWDL_01150 [Nocardioides sp.]